MTPDRGYVMHRASLVAEAIARNLLGPATTLPYALGPRLTERAGTFVCVGAGPSLAETGSRLAELQKAGACICTVNTALPAVAQWCVPDVVLVREIVDVSTHLQHPAKLRVLDVNASPKVWSAAMEQGPCAWFVPGSLNHTSLSRLLGVRPLFGGPAALTALVALCDEWGASEIVLLGCDLALASDGKSYADSTAFSGMRAEVVDGVAHNGGDGFATKLAQHASGGVEAYARREPTFMVPGRHGPVQTLRPWLDQIRWLETFGARRMSRGYEGMLLNDATGAGALKGWWQSIGASRWWAMAVAPTLGPVLGPTVRDRLRSWLLSQCENSEGYALGVLSPGHVPPHLMPAAFGQWSVGCDLVEMMAAREMMLVSEAALAPVDGICAVYAQAIPEAAARLRAVVGDA